MKHKVATTVNGRKQEHEVEPRDLLVYFLREDLGLTGTHVGCDTSQCGACTVLIDDRPGQVVHDVRRPGRRAPADHDRRPGHRMASCTRSRKRSGTSTACSAASARPGFLMTATALLRSNPNPTEEEIRKGLEGNLCRCTGYTNIVKAVQVGQRDDGSGAPAPVGAAPARGRA